MTPLYIFDLDGTLALTEHRQHILDDKSRPDRWSAFFAACVDDLPNLPVIATMGALVDAGADVLVWSGRSAEVWQQTRLWINRHLPLAYGRGRNVRMRDAGDWWPCSMTAPKWLQCGVPKASPVSKSPRENSDGKLRGYLAPAGGDLHAASVGNALRPERLRGLR